MRSSAKARLLKRGESLTCTPMIDGRLSRLSRMMRLNIIGDKGSPCLTPRSNFTLDIETDPQEMVVLEFL